MTTLRGMNRKKSTKPLRQILAENTRRLRLERGLSQERLAELAGFHRTYVSQLERGRTNLGIDGLERLGALLKVPPATLLVEYAAPEPTGKASEP